MTDINKKIEEEAMSIEYKQEIDLYSDLYEGVVSCEYAHDLMESLKIEAYKNGYNKALHSSRWRKVSEEMPGYSVDVLCKYDSGTLFIGYLSKVDNAFRVANPHYNVIREVVEWKPID